MSKYVGHVAPYVSGSNFKAYEDRLRQFMNVNEIPLEKLTPLFITICGCEIQELLMTLTLPDLPSSRTFENLLSLLRNHFSPPINKRAERFKFHKAKQEKSETISDFAARLKLLVETCNFGDFIPDTAKVSVQKYKLNILEDLLTDRFITGVREGKIQVELLKTNDLSFEEYTKLALNCELSLNMSKSLNIQQKNRGTLQRDQAQSRSNRPTGSSTKSNDNKNFNQPNKPNNNNSSHPKSNFNRKNQNQQRHKNSTNDNQLIDFL